MFTLWWGLDIVEFFVSFRVRSSNCNAPKMTMQSTSDLKCSTIKTNFWLFTLIISKQSCQSYYKRSNSSLVLKSPKYSFNCGQKPLNLSNKNEPYPSKVDCNSRWILRKLFGRQDTLCRRVWADCSRDVVLKVNTHSILREVRIWNEHIDYLGWLWTDCCYGL
jgi:hypothetical protein